MSNRRGWRLGWLLCAILLLTACQKAPIGTLADGQPVYLTDYHGQWLVVNYWAKWCKPCLTELPELNALAKHNPNIIVWGVSFDPLSSQEITQFAQGLKLTFPMLQSFNYRHFGLEHIAALPMTLVINPHGQLIKVLVGPQTQAELLAVMNLERIA